MKNDLNSLVRELGHALYIGQGWKSLHYAYRLTQACVIYTDRKEDSAEKMTFSS